MGAITELERRAEEAEQRAERLRKMVEFARELGDEGVREFAAFFAGVADSHPAVAAEPAQAAAMAHPSTIRIEPARRVPRGRDALRMIVRERPGHWTQAQLRQAMKDRGWFTSAKAVEVAARRLCEIDGEGRRLGPGEYVFPAAPREEVEDQNRASNGTMIPLIQ